MNAYLAGQGISVTIDAVDSAGNPVSASAASYRVIDQDGNELVAMTPIADWTDASTSYSATVPAASNTLTAGQLRALRTVELHMQATGPVIGMVVNSVSYVIEAVETLVVPSNSFQTYQQAVMTAFNMVALDRWQGTAKQQRTAALAQAWRNICALRFRNKRDGQSYLSESFAVGNLAEYTATEYATLPSEFRESLTRAQVIEADHLLRSDSDPVKMRESGIRSHTVGESSTTFTAAGVAQAPVCAAALKELMRYVETSLRIGRA